MTATLRLANRKQAFNEHRRVASPATRQRHERGSILIIFAASILFILSVVGLALDAGQLYNRKIELQSVSKAAALAAAQKLNGTSDGIRDAITAAASAATQLNYSYNNKSVTWSDAAISFSASPPPNAEWVDAGSAEANPGQIFYVKVDTSELDGGIGEVSTIWMHIFDDSNNRIATSDTAVAGRTSLNITPLAICALSTTPAAARTNPGPPVQVELVEFGFRRGVSYDLLNLNSNGNTPENFLVNPIVAASSMPTSAQTSIAVVGPLVCEGAVWMPNVLQSSLNLVRPFPIGSLQEQLNSRFGDYDANLCKPAAAPPDKNVKEYTFNSGVNWMTAQPGAQTATPLSTATKLWTVADPDSPPASNTAPSWGPLWAYAKPVPYANYVANPVEPKTGYPTFGLTHWASLYKPGPPVAKSNYPSSAKVDRPYLASLGTHFSGPTGDAAAFAVRNRRVLNIPLLSCPIAPGTQTTGTVLGIGKFFMTMQATSSNIYAEFAGTVTQETLGGKVEILQ